MDVSALLPYISNGSIAIVLVFLILTKVLVPGWMYRDIQKENKELKNALGSERSRADIAVDAARTSRDVLLSLRGRLYNRSLDDYEDLE